MEIKNARYIKTALKMEDLPTDGLIEIGLSGRSNVGKSSFINAICNNNKLARTSKTPGKTITLNFYLINESFYFVDMPGYGHASRELDVLKNFSEATNEYVEKRENLKGFIQIIDSRVITDDDRDMNEYLKSRNIPYIVVLSKIDKLKRNDIKKRINFVKEELKISDESIVGYSSYTHENEEKVLSLIEKMILAS